MATPPSASAAGTLKTGAAFTLSASTSTSAFDGYSGSLARDASKFSAQTTAQDSSVASGGVVGTLTAPSLTANAVTANNASYDEVGYLYLSAGAYADTSFTTVDQGGDCVAGSTSASAIGGKYGCVIGNSATVSLGRFIPDHFDVAVASQGAMAAACLAGGFTYTGQPMVYGASTLPTLSIKPMSAASGGHVTQNYQGVFQKLTSAGVSITLPTTDATQLGKDGAAKTLLTTTAGSATLSNSGGTLSYARGSTESFTFTRDANSLVAPYTSGIALAVTGVADGEVVATGSLPTLSPTGTSMRYGRLRLQNAYGSERLALPVPLEAQYWAGNYYVTNSNDSCTVIPMSAIVMDNYKSQLNACETRISPTGSVTLSAGKLPGTGLLLSAPGVGNSGSVDLTLNLTASASGNTCLAAAPAAATAANLPWFGANPTARATFGIFKSPLIYRRENY
jgi:MSHA biogenesis protein MshQ